MSDTERTTVDPEARSSLQARWQRHADGRESIVLPSDLAYPALQVTCESLVAHFSRRVAPHPLRNPHHENKVTDEQRAEATPAAVLIPLVARGDALSVVLTERHESISYAGHLVFPGGRRDESDESALHNALREAEEEIGISPERIRLLGRLGDYVTHSGFRISPFVSLIEAPITFRPNPGEVEAVVEIPLDHVLHPDSYELRGWKDSEHAHYLLRHGDVLVAGPTVSMLIGLYESLVETHEAP